MKVFTDLDLQNNELLHPRIDLSGSSTGWIRHKAVSLSELNALRDAGEIVTRMLYLVTDQDALAMGETSTSYHLFENNTKTGVVAGSNSDGNYIKWPNGTMHCWKEAVIAENVAADTYVEVTWTFPEPFLAGNNPFPYAFCRSFNSASSRELAARHLRPVAGGLSPLSAAIGVYNNRASTLAARVDAYVWGPWK